MEENTLVLLILGIYFPSLFAVMWGLKRPKTGKQKIIKESSDTVSEMFDTSSRGYKDIIKVKDNVIRSLQAKLNLEKQDGEDQGLLDQEPTWEDVKALAKTEGINPLYLEVPMFKKEIKKLIKGMTIGEISENVAEIKKLAESKGFKLGTKKDGTSEDPVAKLLEQNPDAFH